VAGLSSFISKNLTRYNIYKSMIAQKGGNPEPKQEELILKSAKVKQIMQTNIVTFRQEQRLREILQVILEDKQSIYPVLDKDGSLSGIINERNVRPFVLKKQIHDLVLACDLMLPPEPILHPEDTLRNATLFFDRMNCSFLPVCEEGQLLGMLAREDILSYYRTKLNEKADLF